MKRTLLILCAGLIVSGGAILLIKHYKKSEISSHKTISKEARIKEIKEYFEGLSTPFDTKKSSAPANYLWEELKKLKAAKGKFQSAEKSIGWMERGPANLGGRTRALIVDPDDPTYMTWFAGSASGGLWKTTNGGESWICLSNDLPYQSTTTLAMAKSNTDVIYMGTGESFFGGGSVTGGGVLRSTDRGESWTFLEATSGNEDYRFINRIEVDPENDSIVLVATP